MNPFLGCFCLSSSFQLLVVLFVFPSPPSCWVFIPSLHWVWSAHNSCSCLSLQPLSSPYHGCSAPLTSNYSKQTIPLSASILSTNTLKSHRPLSPSDWVAISICPRFQPTAITSIHQEQFCCWVQLFAIVVVCYNWSDVQFKRVVVIFLLGLIAIHVRGCCWRGWVLRFGWGVAVDGRLLRFVRLNSSLFNVIGLLVLHFVGWSFWYCLWESCFLPGD